MKSVYGEVGEGIRARRLQLGLTLEDLGELADLHASYIGQIERNTKKASLATVATLARALGVPVGRLFADADWEPGHLFTEQMHAVLRSVRKSERKLILAVVRELSRRLKELK